MPRDLHDDREFNLNEPVPGYYKRQMVKGGVWVPVIIYRGHAYHPRPARADKPEVSERGWQFRALVLGDPVDPYEEWIRCCSWPIDKGEYDYRMALYRHAVTYDITLPEAAPRSPVDLQQMKTIY